VRVGLRGEEFVEITAGLKPGERVRVRSRSREKKKEEPEAAEDEEEEGR
jgi:multidrug efflux pump subunit AcrA (membrane-fusion protein)